MGVRVNAAVVAAVVSSVVCLTFFMLVFWLLNYPEIRINTDFIESSCTIVSAEIVPYTCCKKTHCSCSSCPGSAPSCSSALSNQQPGACCDGYECCQRVCSTCTTCTGSGKKRHCSSHSCHCHCSYSVSDSYCKIVCNTCYEDDLIVSYHDASGNTHQATYTDDCGTSLTCADNFINEYAANSTHQCWYDPDDFGSIVFHRGYTWWKWFLMSIPASFILAGMVAGTYAAFRACVARNKRLATTFTSFVWCGVVFPFAFFLPLAEFGAISDKGRTALLVLCAVFASVSLVVTLVCLGVWWWKRAPPAPTLVPPLHGGGYQRLAPTPAATQGIVGTENNKAPQPSAPMDNGKYS